MGMPWQEHLSRWQPCQRGGGGCLTGEAHGARTVTCQPPAQHGPGSWCRAPPTHCACPYCTPMHLSGGTILPGVPHAYSMQVLAQMYLVAVDRVAKRNSRVTAGDIALLMTPPKAQTTNRNSAADCHDHKPSKALACGHHVVHAGRTYSQRL